MWPPLRLVDDVAQIAEIVFEHVERAEPVQRLDRVISVADPAVAIVPVAAAVRRLGDRGGQRGDDRAGLLVLAQLQRDRGADHDLLPFERDGEAAHPVAPMRRRSGGASSPASGRRCRRTARRGRGRNAAASSSRKLRPSSRWPTGASVVSRSGCGFEQIADVVGAAGPLGVARAPVGRRVERDPDPRRAGERPDDADEGDRPVHPPRPLEARAEIEDLGDRAVGVGQPGGQDRRVA